MGKRAFRKNLITFVVFAQIVGIFVWTAPKYRAMALVLGSVHRVLSPFVLFFGLSQSWSMFAPSPRIADLRVSAVATMKDKSQRVWSIPNPLNIGFFRRHQVDRYRKWANDHLKKDNNEENDLFKEAGRFVQGQLDEPGNPVVYIDFYYEVRKIFLHDPSPDWEGAVVYRYTIAEHSGGVQP
jgi:hypothetical protein